MQGVARDGEMEGEVLGLEGSGQGDGGGEVIILNSDDEVCM